MAAEIAMLPEWWRGKSPLLRAALGAVWLATQAMVVRQAGWTGVAAAGGFFAYSLSLLVFERLRRSKFAPLTLVVDTVFYLILAALGANDRIWLSFAFYLYLMLSAALLYHWRDAVVVGGACAAFYLVVLTGEAGLLWPAVLVGVVLAVALAHLRQALEDRLREASEGVEAARVSASSARGEERERIAGDLHDGPLQSFISFQVRLEVLRKILERDKDRAMEELAQLQELWRAQVGDLRSFIRRMRPVEVEAANLLASLRRVAETFQKDSGITTSFASDNSQAPSSPETALEALQILREALHNAQKHSKASRVAVTAERTGKVLTVAVADDGTGFSFSGAYTLEELELLRMGPGSIKQRVRKLGGELVVESRPGRGAELRIRIPL